MTGPATTPAARSAAAPRSDALVVFGFTGDLARKQIIPALYQMVKRGTLAVAVIGVASSRRRLAQPGAGNGAGAMRFVSCGTR
jgi:hypothetical protein